MSVGKKWLVTLTGFVAAMVVASPAALANGAPSALAPLKAPAGEAVQGKYIVVLKTDKSVKGDLRANSATARSTASKHGITVERQFRHAIHGFSAKLTDAQLAKIRQDPSVAYVEPEQVVKVSPNVSAKATQVDVEWNLDRIDQRSNNLDGRYNYTADGSFVHAYIIDTGIWSSHPDFQGRVKPGHGSIQDGYGTYDCEGHGTHVAGTVGSRYYGVAKNVSLVPVRVLDCYGDGTTATVIDGVDWVTANHAPWSVANMSLGGSVSQGIDDAVNRSMASGVTYVVAAGNDSVDACSKSPARVADALTVGATDDADKRSIWTNSSGQVTGGSNWGSCVDLFAPGTDVLSTFNPYLYEDLPYYEVYGSGTSMAAPHVTGAAALFLQKNLHATPAEVRAAIIAATTNDVVVDPQGSANRLLYTPGASNTVAPTRGPSEKGKLHSGESLIRNSTTGQNTITSPDNRFTLTLQAGDGNLVLYEYGKRALWASGMKSGAAWLLNQPDGNLVDYGSNGAYAGWASNSGGGKATLEIQNDGNVVLYRDSDRRVLWSTGTCCHAAPPPVQAAGSSKLENGKALILGGKITSPNGVYTLVLQDFDGNLVLYKNGTQALWAFGPRADSWFVNQPDGNMVAYRSEGGVAWSSNTYGRGAGTLELQDDGNLVLYRNSDRAVIWATNTYGR